MQVHFLRESGVDLGRRYLFDASSAFARGGDRFIAQPDYGTTFDEGVRVERQLRNTEDAGRGAGTRHRAFLAAARRRRTAESGPGLLRPTPAGAERWLATGWAFGVRGERTQLAYEYDERHSKAEERWRIRLRNHRDTAITVNVREHLYRHSDWSIIEVSHDYFRLDADTIRFEVAVPAGERVDVTYRVRYGPTGNYALVLELINAYDGPRQGNW